jgi:hypothetical protein
MPQRLHRPANQWRLSMKPETHDFGKKPRSQDKPRIRLF